MSNIEKSLNVIRAELGNLMQIGILNPAQYASIMAQLPVRDLSSLPLSFLSNYSSTLRMILTIHKQTPGQPSPYVDPHYGGAQAQGFNQQLQAAQQDPNHPANPQNKHHGEWAKKFATKLGNAATFVSTYVLLCL